MNDKTQKIAAEIHRKLKELALKEDKTLQEITEEILENGLESRGIKVNRGTGDGDRDGSRKKTD